jgi:hypothetical protein
MIPWYFPAGWKHINRLCRMLPSSNQNIVIKFAGASDFCQYDERDDLGMVNKMLILFLSIILLAGVSIGLTVQNAQGAGIQKNSQLLTASRREPHRPKISRAQAVNIALNAHKRSQVLSVVLYQSVYTIRLKTFWGKRTVKVGANTGRILYDRLDWASKSK